MAGRFGLIALILIIGILLTYFAYEAIQDDYSSGFLSEFTDSGLLAGKFVTKALSSGDSALIRIDELLADDKNETGNATTNKTIKKREITKKTIVIG